MVTVVVGFLEVHVDDASGPNAGHLIAIQSPHLGKGTGLNFVAAVLCEEDRDRVLLELRRPLIEAGLLKGRLSTPRINVVAPEVDRVLPVAAVKVGSKIVTDSLVVVGGVTDTHRPVVLLPDVRLRVPDGRLDESAGSGVVGLIGNFVSGEETESVGVLCEHIDDGGVASVEVVVPGRVVPIDRPGGFRQVGNHVDACLLEQAHAGVVIRLRVDGVHADGVGVEVFEERNVAAAPGLVRERVDVAFSTTDRAFT